MTTLSGRRLLASSAGISRASAYEWRWFLGQAHCYRRDQLAADWPAMLLPWCEEDRPMARRHERPNISDERVPAPAPQAMCPDCGHLLRAANQEARHAYTPQPRRTAPWPR
jgi:hypothetical protein